MSCGIQCHTRSAAGAYEGLDYAGQKALVTWTKCSVWKTINNLCHILFHILHLTSPQGCEKTEEVRRWELYEKEAAKVHDKFYFVIYLSLWLMMVLKNVPDNRLVGLLTHIRRKDLLFSWSSENLWNQVGKWIWYFWGRFWGRGS